MDEVGRQALVAGYVRYRETLSGPASEIAARGPDERAFEAVERIIDEGPADLAWELVLDILRYIPDSELGMYAAGPLEDVVRIHGAALVAAIEQEAAADARFRWALGCIWLAEIELPAPALARVVRASGGRIEPLRRPLQRI